MDRTLWRSVANDSVSSHFTRVGFRFLMFMGVTALSWALERGF